MIVKGSGSLKQCLLGVAHFRKKVETRCFGANLLDPSFCPQRTPMQCLPLHTQVRTELDPELTVQLVLWMDLSHDMCTWICIQTVPVLRAFGCVVLIWPIVQPRLSRNVHIQISLILNSGRQNRVFSIASYFKPVTNSNTFSLNDRFNSYIVNLLLIHCS